MLRTDNEPRLIIAFHSHSIGYTSLTWSHLHKDIPEISSSCMYKKKKRQVSNSTYMEDTEKRLFFKVSESVVDAILGVSWSHSDWIRISDSGT